MKYQNMLLFFLFVCCFFYGKKDKNIINLSFAKFAQRLLKVKEDLVTMSCFMLKSNKFLFCSI